jgi:hypothetical protein
MFHPPSFALCWATPTSLVLKVVKHQTLVAHSTNLVGISLEICDISPIPP